MIFLIFSVLFLTVPISEYAAGNAGIPLKDKYSELSLGDNTNFDTGPLDQERYITVRHQYEEKGYKAVRDVQVVLNEKNITASDKGQQDIPLKMGVGGKDEPVLFWTDEYKWFEWKFEIPREGLYEIHMDYYIPAGSGISAHRQLMIDEKVPFLEANNISFYRMWKDEDQPRINNLGDEVIPKQVEIEGWQTAPVTDSEGWYPDPLLFYFTEGMHTIRMNYLDQAIAIDKITLKGPEEILSYAETVAEYREKGYNDAKETVKFQAEGLSTIKNDSTLRQESDGDPLVEPRSIKNIKLNILGGWRWRQGNQSITWEFEVPDDGLYKIGIRCLQTWNDGLPSYRQIAIDGKVPFYEMKEYKFVFQQRWQTEVLKDANGEPYLFYLTKGKHQLTMTVKLGPIREILNEMLECNELLSKVIWNIVMITSSSPDPNFDYELDKRIPDLMENIKSLSDSTQQMIDFLMEISNKRTSMASSFATFKSQLDAMLNNPFIIAGRLNNLTDAQEGLGMWILNIKNQPLAVDYFLLGPKNEEWPNKQSNIFQRIETTWVNFISSFFKDYTNIGSVNKSAGEASATIKVWTARGKEWAEIMKELADESFTPITGIHINVNVIPEGQLNTGSANVLMLSVISGRAPDVVLGTSPGTPVEFAMRDAVLNLAQFDDFEEVRERFIPGIMIPYEYRGAIYGLPETMNFQVLFYRKDILNELKIPIPDTWDDIYRKVLPILYRNRMKFTPGNFSIFLFQRGGSFYRENGMKSGLDTPEAYQAFKEWTGQYVNYKMPVQYSFFNRFRSGEMPMGIGDFGFYVTVSVAAPELLGKWGIALIPGHVQQDGSIDRSAAGASGQTAMILNQTKYPRESWEFLKWWTSYEVQLDYGREMEAVIGPTARWNTANVEAFKDLPWNIDDIKVISEQLKWLKETPVVPGGYFTGRHLTNAFTQTVMQGVSNRDALENAIKEINRELITKQEELGLIDKKPKN